MPGMILQKIWQCMIALNDAVLKGQRKIKLKLGIDKESVLDWHTTMT